MARFVNSTRRAAAPPGAPQRARSIFGAFWFTDVSLAAPCATSVHGELPLARAYPNMLVPSRMSRSCPTGVAPGSTVGLPVAGWNQSNSYLIFLR